MFQLGRFIGVLATDIRRANESNARSKADAPIWRAAHAGRRGVGSITRVKPLGSLVPDLRGSGECVCPRIASGVQAHLARWVSSSFFRARVGRNPTARGVPVAQNPSVGREVSSIPDRGTAGWRCLMRRTRRNAFAPIEPLRPPKGAPNVLSVLLDDVGFAAGRHLADRCTCRQPSDWRATGRSTTGSTRPRSVHPSTEEAKDE